MLANEGVSPMAPYTVFAYAFAAFEATGVSAAADYYIPTRTY